ncbi:MAG TPA: response regulator [Nitrospiraceae bacterium]|nr:response regulator [Nitrospiraceae bacterium]
MATLRVLLVDDNATVLTVLEELLRRNIPSIVIMTASSGQDALRVLQTATVDVVLSDVSMPNGDGFFLLEEVQRQWPSLPVVLMSGEPVESRALEAGAKAFFSKPLDPHRLIETLTALTSRTMRVVIRRNPEQPS